MVTRRGDIRRAVAALLAAIALGGAALSGCSGSSAAPVTLPMTTASRQVATTPSAPATHDTIPTTHPWAAATATGPVDNPARITVTDPQPATVTSTAPPPTTVTTSTPAPVTITRTATVAARSTAAPPATEPNRSGAATSTRAPTSSAAGATRLPVAADTGNATQLITVAAPSRASTEGTLTAWERGAGGWHAVVGPVHAYLGSEGIGPSSEQHSRTPQGTFTLTQAFGRQADPGSGLPYFRTDLQDWWVSDVNAPTYNTHQRCTSNACPFDTGVSEQLATIDPEYDYAVVIDANMNPVVPGDGSAFFLHVANGGPTAGCVAIDAGTLLRIIRWLDPARHPRIAIGVG